MKISEIIKKNRIKQGLTQENVAEYLGVSTPAVNKWERGISYPDITLLAPLARLLKTDVNTLLSFKEDLTDSEIGVLSNELVDIVQEEGFESDYNMAWDKIQKYPNSDRLIYTFAQLLNGSLSMFGDDGDTKYYEQIEKLYERVAISQVVLCQEKVQIKCELF